MGAGKKEYSIQNSHQTCKPQKEKHQTHVAPDKNRLPL